MIKIPIKVGDTILMGKFKNKKVIIKEIGEDEYGMPTINGKKACTFRIPDKEEIKKEDTGSIDRERLIIENFDRVLSKIDKRYK